MKRTMILLLLAALIAALSACGQASTEPVAASPEPTAAQAAEESAADGTKVLVAYFSQTGNTRPLAEYAAELLQADLFEIKAAEPYTDEDINYNDSGSRATLEQKDPSARPAISGTPENLDAYDVIVLAYPIWWGQAPRIISTFLESCDFSGKTIVPFCTSGSSGIGSSAENLQPLCADTAVWVDGKRFSAGAFGDLEDWLRELPELSPWLS